MGADMNRELELGKDATLDAGTPLFNLLNTLPCDTPSPRPAAGWQLMGRPH